MPRADISQWLQKAADGQAVFESGVDHYGLCHAFERFDAYPKDVCRIPSMQSCRAKSLFSPQLRRMGVECIRQEFNRFSRPLMGFENPTYLDTV